MATSRSNALPEDAFVQAQLEAAGVELLQQGAPLPLRQPEEEALAGGDIRDGESMRPGCCARYSVPGMGLTLTQLNAKHWSSGALDGLDMVRPA